MTDCLFMPLFYGHWLNIGTIDAISAGALYEASEHVCKAYSTYECVESSEWGSYLWYDSKKLQHARQRHILCLLIQIFSQPDYNATLTPLL